MSNYDFFKSIFNIIWIVLKMIFFLITSIVVTIYSLNLWPIFVNLAWLITSYNIFLQVSWFLAKDPTKFDHQIRNPITKLTALSSTWGQTTWSTVTVRVQQTFNSYLRSYQKIILFTVCTDKKCKYLLLI